MNRKLFSVLIICFTCPFVMGQKGFDDDINYRLRVSLEASLNKAEVHFMETSEVYKSGGLDTYLNRAQGSMQLQSQVIVCPALSIDLRLWRGLKLTGGVFGTNFNFQTGSISGTYNDTRPRSGNSSGTYSYTDHIRLNSLNIFLGVGLTHRIKRWVFDLDFSAKCLIAYVAKIERSYPGNGSGFEQTDLTAPYPYNHQTGALPFFGGMLRATLA